MKSIVKLKGIGLAKFNNAEYSNHMNRTLSLTEGAGAEALGVEPEVLAQFEEKTKSMQDLVARSMVEDQTAELTDLDKQRDTLGRYIIDTTEMLCTTPIASKAEAAKKLYVVLEPYKGFYALPNQQETAAINGMLVDLTKEENSAHVATLGLVDYLAELSSVHAKYQLLVEERNLSRATDTTDSSKALRTEIDGLYDYITTVAFCQSVINPSEAASLFVAQMNVLVDEANTAYNQRMAQEKEKEEETETPTTPEE